MKRTIVFALCLYMISCTNRKSIPKDVLPMDSMQNIMKDLVMAGEYATKFVSQDSTIKDKVKANQDLMETVFKIHNITREEFKHSLTFYESRPDLNKLIFDSLAADANRNKPDLNRPRTSGMNQTVIPVKPTHIPTRKMGLPAKSMGIPSNNPDFHRKPTDTPIKRAP
ncbi:MAG TPA: DUF4296 domain-containing protein [Puia sp.]|nr:DUF4296 domain-containing protein [Puia sp.]